MHEQRTPARKQTAAPGRECPTLCVGMTKKERHVYEERDRVDRRRRRVAERAGEGERSDLPAARIRRRACRRLSCWMRFVIVSPTR